jgi:hypothetical protein
MAGKKPGEDLLRPDFSIYWITSLLFAGCDPVISVAGANFPVWLMCLIAGILASLFLRPVFVATGMDQWMTPRPLVYSCLALTIAFVCWLLLWR